MKIGQSRCTREVENRKELVESTAQGEMERKKEKQETGGPRGYIGQPETFMYQIREASYSAIELENRVP